jgi:hypothetical protein
MHACTALPPVVKLLHSPVTVVLETKTGPFGPVSSAIKEYSILDFALPVREIIALVNVVLPLERLEIAEDVCTTGSDGLDMVDLPSKWR